MFVGDGVLDVPFRERPAREGVPSPKTIHRIVFEFTLCGYSLWYREMSA